MDIKAILVPLDFSGASLAALDLATEYADHFGSVLHLLHCHGGELTIGAPFRGVLPVDFADQMHGIARDMLEAERSKLRDRGFETHTHLRAEAPTECIATTADAWACDLIVMGTRGLSGLAHVMLGSVAEHTLRSAPCPVLVVRDPKDT